MRSRVKDNRLSLYDVEAGFTADSEEKSKENVAEEYSWAARIVRALLCLFAIYYTLGNRMYRERLCTRSATYSFVPILALITQKPGVNDVHMSCTFLSFLLYFNALLLFLCALCPSQADCRCWRYSDRAWLRAVSLRWSRLHDVLRVLMPLGVACTWLYLLLFRGLNRKLPTRLYDFLHTRENYVEHGDLLLLYALLMLAVDAVAKRSDLNGVLWRINMMAAVFYLGSVLAKLFSDPTVTSSLLDVNRTRYMVLSQYARNQGYDISASMFMLLESHSRVIMFAGLILSFFCESVGVLAVYYDQPFWVTLWSLAIIIFHYHNIAVIRIFFYSWIYTLLCTGVIGSLLRAYFNERRVFQFSKVGKALFVTLTTVQLLFGFTGIDYYPITGFPMFRDVSIRPRFRFAYLSENDSGEVDQFLDFMPELLVKYCVSNFNKDIMKRNYVTDHLVYSEGRVTGWKDGDKWNYRHVDDEGVSIEERFLSDIETCRYWKRFRKPFRAHGGKHTFVALLARTPRFQWTDGWLYPLTDASIHTKVLAKRLFDKWVKPVEEVNKVVRYEASNTSSVMIFKEVHAPYNSTELPSTMFANYCEEECERTPYIFQFLFALFGNTVCCL